MLEGQIQSGEFVVFLIALAGLAIVSLESKPSKRITWFFLAYAALFAGTVFTLIEGFAFSNELNLAEHGIGIALAGLLFALCAYRANAYLAKVENKLRDKKWITS